MTAPTTAKPASCQECATHDIVWSNAEKAWLCINDHVVSWTSAQARAVAHRKAERDRISTEHRGAHDRANDCERRAVEYLNKGDAGTAIALALLAVSARLDECADQLEDVAWGAGS